MFFGNFVKRFIPRKSVIMATDMNSIIERLNRLEKLNVSGPLHKTETSKNILLSLGQTIVDIDFAVLNEELFADRNKYYSARLLYQNDETQYVATPDNLFEFVKPTSEGLNVNVRNLFRFCADEGSYICIVKFKRGRGEYIIVQAECPIAPNCDDPFPSGPFVYTP